jgi:hypothetical protein
MTKFDAHTYASGLTVANFIAAIDAGEITQTQGLAVCEAKTSRANIRKGALARWTRVAEGLKAKNIDKDYAFTGKRADEPKATPKPKAKAQPKADLPIERMNALVSKRIMSKAERAELSGLIAAYVAR